MEILKEFKSTTIYSRLVTVLSVLSQKISGFVDLDRSIRDASEKTNFWYILYTSLMPYIIYNKLKEEKGIAQIFDAPINLEDTSNILAYSPEIVTNYSYINPILAYIGLCCIYVLLVPYL